MNSEKIIQNFPEPITIDNISTINEQMNKCVCKIITKNSKGTGFLIKMNHKKKEIHALITSSFLLDDIKENDQIQLLFNCNIENKTITINKDRKKHINKELEIAVIEILEKDNINNYFELDDIFKENIDNFYMRKSIYIIHYTENVLISFGILQNLHNNEIMHLCKLEEGSSGGPIINLSNNKVIGMHIGGSKHKKYFFNKGVFLKEPLDLFQKEIEVKTSLSNKINNSMISKSASPIDYNENEKPIDDLSIYNNKQRSSNCIKPNIKKTKTITSKNKYYMCKKCNQIPLLNYNSSLKLYNVSCKCSKKENVGIKYIAKHYLIQKNKNSFLQCQEHKKIFNYYCKDCSRDICDDCLLKDNYHSNHNLIYFDLLIFDTNIRIEKIKEKFSINNKIKNSDNTDNDDKKINDIFIEILMNEIEISPNYNLFKTIENIYNSLFFEKKEIIKKNDFENVKNTLEIANLLLIGQKLDNIEIFLNKNLQNLNVLSLRNNNINDLSPLLKCNFENLKFLDLSYNDIDDYAIDIFGKMKLNKLNILNLSSNNLNSFTFFKSIEHISSLKELYVDNNKFNKNYYDDNYELPSIQEISFSDGCFSTESINLIISKFKFKDLKKLYLNNNSLNSSSFIEKIECSNLEEIYLNNNNINKFECFKKYVNLKIIEIKNNQLTNLLSINSFINSLTKLSMINLNGNNIDLKSKINVNILKKIISKNIRIIMFNKSFKQKN